MGYPIESPRPSWSFEMLTMPKKQLTLFERVGGEKAIAELIHDFYERVLADPELKPFF